MRNVYLSLGLTASVIGTEYTSLEALKPCPPVVAKTRATLAVESGAPLPDIPTELKRSNDTSPAEPADGKQANGDSQRKPISADGARQ
jgi:hypothetical protein